MTQSSGAGRGSLLKWGSLTAVAVATLTSAPLKGAQVADVAAGAGGPASAMSDASTIVVTARKKNERLIDVPAVVNVLNEKALAKYATDNIESITNQLPQVMITKATSGTGANVTIRGLGTNASGDDGMEQSVSFSFDGVSTARGRLISQALFDIKSVQVLKGPQALYFGKNSPAGVIVIDSRGPTDELEGYVKAGYEFRAKEYRLEAAIGGPIGEDIGARIAIFNNKMYGGYIKNVAGPIAAATSPVAFDRINGITQPGRSYKWGPGSRQIAGRLTLTYQPSDRLDATFKLLASKYRDNGDQSGFVTTSCPAGSATTLQTDLGARVFTGATGIVADPYSVCGKSRRQSIGALAPEIADTIPDSNGGEQFLETQTYLSSLVMNYKVHDNITLTSVTGFYKGKTRGFPNYDSTAFSLINATIRPVAETWSQELRAVTNFSGPVNLSVGLYYSDDYKTYPYTTALVRSRDPVTSFEVYAAGGNTKIRGESYSAFGELSWKITPEVELAGGARFSKEKKRGVLMNTYVQPGLVSQLGLALPEGIVVRPRYKESNVSPQITLSWRPVENVNLFGGYRTGFKSGGISNLGLIGAAVNETNVVFGKETVKGYEAGVKFYSLDRRIDGEFTVYHYLYGGLQLAGHDSATNRVFVTNAAGATTDGFESSVNFRMTPEFSLRGAVGYNRARYSDFKASQCWAGQTAGQGCVGNRQDLTGRRIVRAPEWTYSGGISWDRELGNALALGASLDGNYMSNFFTTVNNNPYAFQRGYFLVDASVRVKAVNDAWEMALIGRNLTNKFYTTLAGEGTLAVTPGSIKSLVGTPRTILLQATYRY